ncbi:nitroreductase family protein [Vibrio gazogenes]|uniref:Nitroreductase n=1 Tax=Vibrio gazogenes DSM 21264 = NBRC 103151 TaxID=1123492 RepID=A0A1M4TJM6_VIBGA|nr:nitroreductase family protein [Vibrio gazogenes]USP16114.1 nitroreductase family protein [Vibrio gazogenes]SHE44681.1 Nitroreductase [Vibrio gazogenes DSM 21264] [Vibrio gazogenes DSM 21264 = NBRC 103151]SJN54189.1 Putative NAD(P)H nitroreductase MhqN [Vibrio gazogenes]
MNTIEAIRHRRSIKQYDPNYVMNQEDLNTILQAAVLAPTSFNIQHWRFVHVQDQAIRQQLRAAAWDQAQVTDASTLLLVTGDTLSWQESPERYWANVDQQTRETLVTMLQDFYRDREWLQRDEVIRSGAMAAQNIMLAAEDLGYQTSPMIGFDIDKVGEIIRLPENHVIVMMLAIGKGTTQAYPRGGQLPLSEIVIKDQF